MYIETVKKIYSNLNSAYQNLYDGSVNSVDLVGNAVKELSLISQYDKTLSDYNNDIERIMYELQDISREIRNYKENIDFEPYELEQIELRVDEINNLRRKYGDSIEDIFNYYEKMKSRLEEILNRDEKVEELKLEIIRLEKTLKNKADELTKARKEVALRLEEVLLVELKSLNMKNVVFKVNFEETVFNMKGQDDIEFMISFNLEKILNLYIKLHQVGKCLDLCLHLRLYLQILTK